MKTKDINNINNNNLISINGRDKLIKFRQFINVKLRIKINDSRNP